jgi:hypothetical protein
MRVRMYFNSPFVATSSERQMPSQCPHAGDLPAGHREEAREDAHWVLVVNGEPIEPDQIAEAGKRRWGEYETDGSR